MKISEEDAAFDEIEADELEKELTALGHKFQWLFRDKSYHTLRWWPTQQVQQAFLNAVDSGVGPYKLIRVVPGYRLTVLRAIKNNKWKT